MHQNPCKIFKYPISKGYLLKIASTNPSKTF
uniref:Uncharacterized protein n=1 Tax=Arundo donax TaxID=35708 RepID=A0A0A8Y1L9_ARUDO